MATYFSCITADYWVAKNKLAAAAKKVARKMERQIIPGDQVEGYKSAFRKQIEDLNKTFSRCKPLKLEIWKEPSDRTGDIFIDISCVFTINLFKVKEVEP